MATKLENLIVGPGQDIFEVVRVIDNNHMGIAIVVDETKKFIGIVTDADIRRGIMKGLDVHASVHAVMRRDPFTVTEPLEDDQIVKLMQKSRVRGMWPEYIPSLDKNFRPVKVYHISELISVNILSERPDVRKESKRVLLIGGAGYIGSMLVRKLLEHGYPVTVMDKFLYGHSSIKDLENNSDVKIIEGDTRHIDVLVPAIKESGAVVHLAELVGDPLCAMDPQTTYEINYLATATIARICSDLQVNRYIYLSSCSVYGSSNTPDEILDENSKLVPVSLYAKMKINAERAILGTNNENFSPCIFRLGTVFGASFRPRFDLVVNILTAKAMTEKKINIFGGDQWRPHVHVSDVVKAIKIALELPVENVKNQVFNIVSENLRIIDVGKQVVELIPGAKMAIEEDAMDKRNYRVTGQKAEEVLGFNPSKRVKDGILEIADAFRAGAIKDFADPKYHNYKSYFSNNNL